MRRKSESIYQEGVEEKDERSGSDISHRHFVFLLRRLYRCRLRQVANICTLLSVSDELYKNRYSVSFDLFVLTF